MSYNNYSEKEEQINRQLNGYAGYFIGVWVFLVGYLVIIPLVKELLLMLK